MIENIVKVFIPSVIAFFCGIAITPLITAYLYKFKMWKKVSGKKTMEGQDTPIFNSLHQHKEVGTPKLGGSVIWISTILSATLIWIVSLFFPGELSQKLAFISRDQTWIPFATLIIGALIGAFDDFLEINGNGNHVSGGLSLKTRLVAVTIIGLLCGLWFFQKLDIVSIGLPFGYEIYLGFLIVPLFALVMLLIYSGGVIDGLDGLAGGVFAVIFSAYGCIAFYQDQINLAAFCTALVGGILAFLWFNIPPARFYMSETGTMALTLTLTVVAFLTDRLADGYGLFVLPIIAVPLILTTFSNIIQQISKKFRGKKVFLIAPIHHHFEAIGWPSYKVTMRYWIISVIFAIIGVIIALLG